MSAERLKEIAKKLEEIKDQIKDSLEEFKELVKEAEGEADGQSDNLFPMFEAYPYANIATFLDNDSGYLSRNHSLQDVADKVHGIAEEVEWMEENGEDDEAA